MCFYGVYFGYLLTSAYYYYETVTTKSILDLENLIDLQWIVFNSFSHFALIGTSVTISKEASTFLFVFLSYNLFNGKFMYIFAGQTNCIHYSQDHKPEAGPASDCGKGEMRNH